MVVPASVGDRRDGAKRAGDGNARPNGSQDGDGYGADGAGFAVAGGMTRLGAEGGRGAAGGLLPIHRSL